MSLLVYSHVLSTLMSTALIIIFIFIRLVSKGFKNADFIAIFKKLFSAAGMTLVLTSAFGIRCLNKCSTKNQQT